MKASAIHGESGYERRPDDAYYTESWVTRALLAKYPLRGRVWDPAAGRGDMTRAFLAGAYEALGTDINDPIPRDFLEQNVLPFSDIESIVTNPPYSDAEGFVRHALWLVSLRGTNGIVAMLLRNEWDSASTRRALFEEQPFACKLVLTKRPRWDWWETDKPKASPRHNFSWFIWDYQHSGSPILRYGP